MGKTADAVVPGGLRDFEDSEDSVKSLDSESDSEFEKKTRKKKKSKKKSSNVDFDISGVSDGPFGDTHNAGKSYKTSANTAHLASQSKTAGAGRSVASKPKTPAAKKPNTTTASKPKTPSASTPKTPSASQPKRSAATASNLKTAAMALPSFGLGAKDVSSPGPINLPSSEEFSDFGHSRLSRRQRNKNMLEKFSTELVSEEPMSDSSEKSWSFV